MNLRVFQGNHHRFHHLSQAPCPVRNPLHHQVLIHQASPLLFLPRNLLNYHLASHHRYHRASHLRIRRILIGQRHSHHPSPAINPLCIPPCLVFRAVSQAACHRTSHLTSPRRAHLVGHHLSQAQCPVKFQASLVSHHQFLLCLRQLVLLRVVSHQQFLLCLIGQRHSHHPSQVRSRH